MNARILLIDVSHLFWSCWHASSDKDVSYAYQWTLDQVTKLSTGHEHVAICCDHPPYLRKQEYPEYKAQREAQPVLAVEQFTRAKERLAANGYLVWSVPGFEADDIIATACKLARELSEDAACSITIASNDKDLLQLVSDEHNVCVVSTQTGVEMREQQVRDKFGVEPWQMRDLLALMGDKSDNVPGCPGVGAVNAAKLLAEFGDIQVLYSRIGFVKPDGIREKLKANEQQVRLSRHLVTLRTDVPIEFAQLFEKRESTIIDAEFDDAGESLPPSELTSDTRNRAPSDPPPAPPLSADSEPRPSRKETSLARIEAPKQWTLALEPTDSSGAVKLANLLYESRLFGGFPNAQAVLAVILRGRALGLDATTALSTFHVIEGRPAMHASLIVGLVLRSGLAEYFELVESTKDYATWVTRRVGRQREVEMTYDMEDAQQAGLLRPTKSGKPSNWHTRPKTMLRWRAATELARAVYPDVTTGLYTPDELSDGQAA